MSDVTPTASVDLEGSKRKAASYANYVFFVLFAVNFLNYLDRYVLVGAGNIISQELGFGIEGIGVLSSAFIIFFTLSTIPFGIWADRARRKDIVALSVAAWSLVTSLTGLANSFFTLLLSRMLLGVGEAGYAPASNALIADYFHRSRWARILSWWGVGALLGLMIGIIAGGLIAGFGEGMWRWAFVCTGVPGLLLAVLAWFVREPRRNQAEEDTELAEEADLQQATHTMVVPKNILGQLGLIMRIKTMLVLIAMNVFSYFVLTASIVYLPTLFQQKDSFGMTSAQAGFFTGMGVAIAGVFGAVLGGYLSDIINRRYPGARVLVCGLGFLIGAPSYILSVVVGIGTRNIYLYSIFFFTTTLLLNLYIGPSGAAVQDVVPASLRASAVAISLFIGNFLGNALAPVVVGGVAALLDPTGGQHFATQTAGLDLSLALCFTCPPLLVISGLIAIFGARWVKGDMLAAQRADQLARE